MRQKIDFGNGNTEHLCQRCLTQTNNHYTLLNINVFPRSCSQKAALSGIISVKPILLNYKWKCIRYVHCQKSNQNNEMRIYNVLLQMPYCI